MTLSRALSSLFCAAALALPLALTACGGDEAPPPSSFAPLHYEYLTKLRINVGTLTIENHATQLGPDDVSGQSPVTPAQALLQMAHDRLFAAGLTGTANFVVDQASIVRGANGGLYGQMAVHIEARGADGRQAGYAEARVSRQHLPGSEDENLATTLYGMTRDMMDAMNVELEFQIRRTMPAFLATAAAVPAPVAAAPLPGSPLPPSSAAAPPYPPSPYPAAPLPPAAPATAGTPPGAFPDPGSGASPLSPESPPATALPDGSATPPPVQMSPPPGYLQPPPGAMPQ